MSESDGKAGIVVYGALAANVGIAVAKFIVAAIGGSSALLSEAIHSAADSGNELLLLLGAKRARKPPDHTHPFGRGKEAYFWSLIVAVQLFAIGGGVSIYEGVTHLRHPAPVDDPKWHFIVLGIAFLFEGTSLVIALRTLHRRHRGVALWRAFLDSKDPSVYTVVAEDGAAIVGLVVAFAGIALAHVLHAPRLDAIASLVVGALLVAVGAVVAWESRRLLVGESARDEVIRGVERITREDECVKKVGDVLTMQLGPSEVLVNLAIEFDRELSAGDVQRAIRRIEDGIRRAFPEVRRIFIEASSL